MTLPLRVLFLASEADPFIKIGGLGDVAGSLPLALSQISNAIDVRLAIPLQGEIQKRGYPLNRLRTFDIHWAEGTQWAERGRPKNGKAAAEVYSILHKGVPVYLISGEFIAPDAPVYTSDAYADGLKYTFFSLAALELARHLNWMPHIVHANDWHTAPAVYALSRMRDTGDFFSNTSTVLGLHNLPYLGSGAGRALAAFGLPPAYHSALPWWAQDMPLPLGLLTADHIVAVSPTYAQEILTPEFGVGLQDFLRTRSASISGILNGLDLDRWDPQADPALLNRFDSQSLDARVANKTALQSEFRLQEEPSAPLVAMVTRLDTQKGVDLVPEALRLLAITPTYMDQPWQMIILGTGDTDLERTVRGLQAEFPRRLCAVIRFDADLSRRIFAGADVMLIPSRYEPCGLTQMIAMRYGCVPIARATGGLKDTVVDFNQSKDSVGFLFGEASPGALAESLGRALQVYRDQAAWRGLQQRGMGRDFSWARSAQQYLDLYLKLSDKRRML